MTDVAHLGRIFSSVNPLYRSESIAAVHHLRGHNDLHFGGPATISDDVLAVTVPVVRRVRLYDLPSGRMAREGWSLADGTITFDKIGDGRTWYAVAFDHTGVYPPVAMSYQT